MGLSLGLVWVSKFVIFWGKTDLVVSVLHLAEQKCFSEGAEM